MGINWKSAKNYADMDVAPKERKRTKIGIIYSDEWNEIVDG